MNKKLVQWIFGISLLILLLLSVFAYQRVSTFKNHSDTVDNSNQILLTLSNMKSGYKSIIAEQRSYLITKDTTFYQQFQQERDHLRESLREYQRLTKGNKIHQAYAKKLQEQADNRIQGLVLEMLNDTSSARYKYIQKDLILKNEQINGRFNELLNTIDKHEKSILKRQLRIKEFEEQFTPFVLFLMALAALGIISYSFYLIYNELTTRETTNKLLAENVENLNRSNRELEQYAYVASHDLQEPLRKIRMFADRLMTGYHDKLDEEGKELLNRMSKSSERMTTLIKDLLNLSRLLSDKPEMSNQKLDDIVNEIISDFDQDLKNYNVELDINQLPIVNGHKGQLLQLFQNLIGNAIKFSRNKPKPIIRIKADITTRWQGDTPHKYHHIQVKDNGIGFDNQFKDKMFVIFGRLEKSGDIEGTGIGLNICDQIMENHNGFIDAEGVLGEGAVFHLFFPADF